jgi:hypothetical protein
MNCTNTCLLLSHPSLQVKKLQYDYFPLIQDGELALEGVCDTVMERLCAMSCIVNPDDVSNSKVIASVLNDLEDQSAYLSTINQLFRVRVCLSDIADPSVASFDGSSFRSRSSANESDSKTKRSTESSEHKATKRSLGSSDSGSSSIGHSEKRSKSSKDDVSAKSQQVCNSSAPKVLSLIELGDARCGDCILCNMPECQRCFSCIENEGTVNKADMLCCIRKVSLSLFISHFSDVVVYPDVSAQRCVAGSQLRSKPNLLVHWVFRRDGVSHLTVRRSAILFDLTESLLLLV